MANREHWMGPGEDSADYFAQLSQRGLDELVELRNNINDLKGDGAHRGERTWGAIKAAEMINRSPQWLRDKDPDVPRNEAGHGRWTLERILHFMDEAGERYRRPEGSTAMVLAMSKFKGGVGNSTNTLHIAHGLATKGQKVLIWDWDAQASSTQIAGGVVPDLELEDEDLPIYAIKEDPASILDPDEEVVRGTYFHNVDLVPANSALNELEMSLINQYFGSDQSKTEIPPSHRMAAVLSYIKNYYDVILIDCPPALGINTMNGLIAADGIITSVKPEVLDRASLVAYVDGLAALCSDQGKSFKYFRILISQFQDGITKNTKGRVQENGHRAGEIALRRLYGEAVFENMMYHSKEISNASSNLSTVIANDKPLGSPRTYKRAVSFVEKLVDEIFEDLKYIWEGERNDD